MNMKLRYSKNDCRLEIVLQTSLAAITFSLSTSERFRLKTCLQQQLFLPTTPLVCFSSRSSVVSDTAIYFPQEAVASIQEALRLAEASPGKQIYVQFNQP